MNKHMILAATAFVAISAAADDSISGGDTIKYDTDYVAVPERAVVLTGGDKGIHHDVVGVLYDADVTFNDPDAPRFLLIDRKGNTVFGIGGYVEGVARYDFGGSVNSNGFSVSDIPVPANPAARSRLGADATHTTLVLNLLHHTRYGVLSAYVQGNFSAANYGFKLKQAYIRLNHVTMGLTRSTFQDALATPATIDYTGPVGMIDRKNVMLQYRNQYDNGIGFGVAAELPPVTITPVDGVTESISQRVPDIPAYVQYAWDGGKSHVRVSAMLRNLSYRDLVDGKNKIVTGYGVQLSGGVQCAPFLSVNYQATYGKGMTSYLGGIEDLGYDLIDSDKAGTMTAPNVFGFSGGVKIQPCDKFFMTSTYSMARVYGQERLGDDAFRRGNYAVVNAFYTPIPDLQFGIEYIHGRRTDMSGEHGVANRIQAMVKYSF